jgi:hypothetical protein
LLPVGRTRYIDFYIADINDSPIIGRTLADWQAAPNRLVLLRDTEACADALALKDYGDGRYSVSYQPSAPGHDYFELYDQAADFKLVDVDDIVPLDWAVGGAVETFAVDHDFGGSGALRIPLAGPESYALYLYLAEDWERGFRDEADAAGRTALDAEGRWKQAVRVASGTYHIVLRKFRETQVFRLNLKVG